MATTIKDIAWVAGLLEGEATFGLTNNKRTPCIWLGSTDQDVVERIRLIVDPTKSITMSEDKRKESYKPMFRITLNGTRAIEWMMTIYSLMSVRRKVKIRETLEIWKLVKLDQSQVRTVDDRRRQSLSFRMRRMGYSDAAIEMAKILTYQKLTDEQIFQRLEAFDITIQ